MKKLKKLLLVLMMLMGVFLVSCGEGPEKVAERGIELMFEGDPTDKTDIKDLMKIADMDEGEATDALSYQTITGNLVLAFESREIQGMENKLNDLRKEIKKAIDIKAMDSKVDGDTAYCNVEVKYPNVSQRDIEHMFVEVMEEMDGDIFTLSDEELQEKAMEITEKTMDILIKVLKNTEESMTETIEVELIKEKGDWIITNVF